MNIIEFIYRIAPVFHCFDWVKKVDFKLKDGRSDKFPSCGKVYRINKNTSGKQPKQLYSRRLTRTLENYAKD